MAINGLIEYILQLILIEADITRANSLPGIFIILQYAKCTVWTYNVGYNKNQLKYQTNRFKLELQSNSYSLSLNVYSLKNKLASLNLNCVMNKMDRLNANSFKNKLSVSWES